MPLLALLQSLQLLLTNTLILCLLTRAVGRVRARCSGAALR